jgi:predicted nucleic acid-binding protein
MAMMAGSRVFIDTNILVYANLGQSPFHSHAVARLQELQDNDCSLYVSRQVLREYLAAMTRPGTLTADIPIISLVEDVRGFENDLIVIDDGPAVTDKLLETVEHYAVAGKQIHDANIVATMLACGIPALLTHNTADFQRFIKIINVIPLLPSSK